MTIEDKVFRRRRFVPALMKEYGFSEAENGFTYESDFMNGSFRAVISVDGVQKVSARVIDVINDEEYFQMRMESFSGPFVSLVRSEYEKLLSDVAQHCCREVLFASDQANRIADLILDTWGVVPDFPWDESPHQTSGVFRHGENSKWFGLIMNIRRGALLKNGDESPVDVMNLKIRPEDGERVRSLPGVYPAYHMNHSSWISVVLDDLLPDAGVMELVRESFRLTAGSLPVSGRSRTPCH